MWKIHVQRRVRACVSPNFLFLLIVFEKLPILPVILGSMDFSCFTFPRLLVVRNMVSPLLVVNVEIRAVQGVARTPQGAYRDVRDQGAHSYDDEMRRIYTFT